jgi:hypothetical protein
MASLRRQLEPDNHQVVAPDRNTLVALAASLAAADETVGGVTLILPCGAMQYIDGALLRRAGHA